MTDDNTPRYSIIFNGELVEGVSRETALNKLVHLTNLSEEELLDCLFSIKPVIASQTANYQLADQFREQFRQAGLIVSTQTYHQSHDDIVNAELSFGHYAPLKTQHTEANFIIDTPASTAIQKSDIHQQTGRYLVCFNGSLLNGYERKQVVANLCSLTKSSEADVIENIFSTIPVIICQTDDRELAQAYQQAFEQSGLEVKILSSNRLSNSEIAARSYLLIRDDKPAPMPKKKVQCFTYTLYGLATLACLGWGTIYMVIDSYLKEEITEPIQIQMVKYKPVETIAKPSPAPAPVKKINAVKKPLPAKKKVAQPLKEQKKEVKSPLPSEEKVAPAKVQEKVVEQKESKEQQQLKEEYNLKLLNWFAQFQQLNQLESKYAEGEITLRLTISRNGEIKKIDVLKSTSEELQRIVVMQLRKAKTVPGIPIKITGLEYAFDLPLRFRFQ